MKTKKEKKPETKTVSVRILKFPLTEYEASKKKIIAFAKTLEPEPLDSIS